MWLYTGDFLLEHKNRNKSNEKLLELIIGGYNSQTRDKYSHISNNNVIEKCKPKRYPIYNHEAKFKLTGNNVSHDNEYKM